MIRAWLRNRTKDSVVLPKLLITDTLMEKFKGLIPFNGLSPEEGLLIPECRSIHTFRMRFDIDCFFLNEEYKVLKIVRNVKPSRMAFGAWGTEHVLEVASESGKILNIDLNDLLEIKETE